MWTSGKELSPDCAEPALRLINDPHVSDFPAPELLEKLRLLVILGHLPHQVTLYKDGRLLMD